MARRKVPIADRFWQKVNKEGPTGTHRPDLGPCWEWTAYKLNGYGRFGVDHGTIRQAHRVAYELLVGAIPTDLDLDHLCRNRACVNPKHLEPKTRQQNLSAPGSMVGRTRKRLAKTECKHGHAYTPENTAYFEGGTQRYCRECHRQRGDVYRDSPEKRLIKKQYDAVYRQQKKNERKSKGILE